jgi:hypothetical protein
LRSLCAEAEVANAEDADDAEFNGVVAYKEAAVDSKERPFGTEVSRVVGLKVEAAPWPNDEPNELSASWYRGVLG